ncbi:cytochrome c biogenesis protein CcsA [Aciditerrimonas ferrireducens]|nr:cytochrome c biogenesis protein CcsA [Aciditerrimonas ferrireducens]MCK4177021.1 cytochrome c biogenesis protein CcsA [Aciditerrimonas ferrireducens]
MRSIVQERGAGEGAGVRPWSPRAEWAVRLVGLAAVVTTGLTVWLGLWVTPPSQVMGNLVRLVYVHPPVAWVALYLAFGALGLGSVLWLWPRTRHPFWDRLAAAAGEVGAVFTALTLATGSIWGRPTWGVWWAWDARLTSSALLLVLLLGYLALRRVPADPDTRARRSAIAALVALLDVPIVYFSVSWWHGHHALGLRGLHLGLRVDAGHRPADRSPAGRAGGPRAGGGAGRSARRGGTGGRGAKRRRARGGRAGGPGRARAARGAPGPGHAGVGSAVERQEAGMSYIDAGYIVALGVLAVYGVTLAFRRRRLERAVAELRRRREGGA